MFYDKFVSLCASAGKKPTPVAQELGISKGTAASWKRRGNDPTDAYLVKIANYFGVSVDDLRGDAENEKKVTTQGGDLSDYDSALLTWFHSLPEEKRRAILISQDAPKELLD
uniref:Helix-turn-helix domain protein n=1 Tax=Siphoviridae sp. ct2hZ16 TaxID=2826276 RepID=A0A8S5QU74_9CAUD|nr:MAG TPA: helix-turn-helix domain protein [Siphoviridae sp. ct2hZ16]